MSKTLIISDEKVRLRDVLDVASHKRKVALSESRDWRARIHLGRKHLLEADPTTMIYGMNTGVGNASRIQLGQEAEEKLQTSLVAQHGCGLGQDLSETEARAVCLARLVSLSKGYSAVRMELLESMNAFINSGLVPAIPELGSVGASGDLTPLSYFAAALTGKRSVYLHGTKVDAGDALTEAGLDPVFLAKKEGIAIMNGTSVMTAIGILNFFRAKGCIETCMSASALATEVICGAAQAFDPMIHDQKPHKGQVTAAASILSALDGSKLTQCCGKERPGEAKVLKHMIQDRYSIRCSPHVLGAACDALGWIEATLETELNSVNDNPMVDPSTGRICMGGNFYGGHVSLAMDLLKIAMASVADLLDRQFALLVDENNNRGLPETLIPGKAPDDPEFGLYHGLKALQLTMTSLSALASQRSQPDTPLSRPTEAGNQDKVSMGTNAALNARQTIELTEQCLAILLVALSQAAHLRGDDQVSPHGKALVEMVREHVPLITADRPIDTEVRSLVEWLRTASLSS